MAPPVDRRLVSDQVFRTLLEALLEGRYAPGEKLPTQRALAADLGVTMSPLREALKRLEQMGLVEVRHGDAMRVRDWRAHGGLDVVGHLVLRAGAVDPGVLGDVFEARALMLRELARLAADRRDDDQAQRLVELAEAVAAAPDSRAAQAIDFAFFSTVADAARNVVFVLILNAIRDAYFEHADRVPVTADHEELAPLYARIAGAVQAGDGDGAAVAAFALAGLQRERVEAALS